MKKNIINKLFEYTSYKKKLILIKEQIKNGDDKLIFDETNKILNKIYDKNFILRIMIKKILLTHYMHLTPYPTEINKLDMELTKVKLNLKKNMYRFEGTPGSNIISTNFIVPDYKNSMIPFTFFTQRNKTIEPILSNIFYYEIYIGLTPNRPSWNSKALGLGYGPTNFNRKKMVGWTEESIGYHSDDGKIFFENNTTSSSKKFGPGDTIGAGVILIDSEYKKFFFTLNGKIIYLSQVKKIKKQISPQVSLDYNHPIKINFGLKEFKYDYTKLLNSNFTINYNNNFIKKLNYENYLVKNTLKIPHIIDIKFEGNSNNFNVSNLINYNNNENIQNLINNQTTALNNLQNLVNEYSSNLAEESEFFHYYNDYFNQMQQSIPPEISNNSSWEESIIDS